ncbi:putative iron-sulfur cluster-binding metallochaperone [Cohnella laeviribosi]|uniref:putative iron-sulfur cluster-binding metallochaperone n=1 Tax=Cohnella laeviribosi TaxID=380174 RepID=UPI0009FED21A
MGSCCQTADKESSSMNVCPVCQQKGKSVPLITLKSLLEPAALETINPEDAYAFCPNPSCEVAYFSDSLTYGKDMLKVSVYQKDDALDVPVCYCFGWTRERLIQAVQKNQQPIDHIRKQVQANRCGCEVNNPQGSCCLGNVTAFVRCIEKG